MRGAVPPLTKSSLPRDARVLSGYAVLLFAGACSVYNSSLVDEVNPITQGGSSAEAGKGSDAAGKSANNGGSSVGEAGGGGQGGEPETGGTAGAEAVGGTDAAGTGNTAGSVSGGTGGTGTAGTGGTGGPNNPTHVLDTFEDNDLLLEPGRSGVWYTFHDSTPSGKLTPDPLVCTPLTDPPAELGMYGMRITATGFTEYGSGLGVDFRAGKRTYDASQYQGIRFWAKVGKGAGTNAYHRVQISDINTDAAGMKCDPEGTTGAAGTRCEDHFGEEYKFTTEWVQYELKFADLIQSDWGYPLEDDAVLQTKSLYGLQFTAKKSTTVDLWIDQVEFFPADP